MPRKKNDLIEVIIESESIIPAEVVNSVIQDARALARLIESGIVDYEDDTVTWREGHLEHIARLYRDNPAQTERDYSDDVTVAQEYSKELWESLLA